MTFKALSCVFWIIQFHRRGIRFYIAFPKYIYLSQLKLSPEQDLGLPSALVTRCAHNRNCAWGGAKGKKIQFKSTSTIPRMSLWTGPTTHTQHWCQIKFWQSSNRFRIPYLTRSHLFRDGNNEPCQRGAHFSLANLFLQQMVGTKASGNSGKEDGNWLHQVNPI